MTDILVLLQLLLVAYIVSLGFGVLFNGQRGAARVTAWWLTGIRKIVGGFFHLIGDIFWKKGKKKP